MHQIIFIPKIAHYYLFFYFHPLVSTFFSLLQILILETGFSLWTAYQREIYFTYALEVIMNFTFAPGDSTLWGIAEYWLILNSLSSINKILKLNSSKVSRFLVLVCWYVCSLRYWQRCILCSYTVSCSAVSKLWPNSMKLNFCRTSCQYIFSYCLHIWYCIWKSGKVIKVTFSWCFIRDALLMKQYIPLRVIDGCSVNEQSHFSLCISSFNSNGSWATCAVDDKKSIS